MLTDDHPKALQDLINEGIRRLIEERTAALEAAIGEAIVLQRPDRTGWLMIAAEGIERYPASDISGWLSVPWTHKAMTY